MIVMSVVVLAIIRSAFAFNAKKVSVFCVTSSINPIPANQTCVALFGCKVTTSSGITRAYYPCWDYDLSHCTLNCTSTPVKFTTD